MSRIFKQAKSNQDNWDQGSSQAMKERAPQGSRRRTGAKCQAGLGCLTSPHPVELSTVHLTNHLSQTALLR